MSDGLNARLVYDGAPAAPSLLDLAGPDGRVMACNSVSKTQCQQDMGHDRLAPRLDSLAGLSGLHLAAPVGAFIGVDGKGDSLTLALRLVRDHGLTLAPGSAFGEGGEGHLRPCFAQSRPRMERAMTRQRSRVFAPHRIRPLRFPFPLMACSSRIERSFLVKAETRLPQPQPASAPAPRGSASKVPPARPVAALAQPAPPHPADPAPAANTKRTEHHDNWITGLGDSLKHDVSAMLAHPGVQSRLQAVERGAHNAAAGAETALLDMKSGVTKVAGHVAHKDFSASLAHDDQQRAHIAAHADKDSLAFKAGGIATHVVVDTAATVALVAGGEFVLGAAGVTTAAATGAASLGLGEAAAGIAGRLAVGTVTNAVGSGIVTGAEGGSRKEVLKSMAVGGLSVGVGHVVGEVLNPLAHAASGRMAQVAPKLAGVSGRAVRVGTEAASGAATGAGVSALTGDNRHDIVQNALSGGALSGMSATVHMRGSGGHEGTPPSHGTSPGNAHGEPTGGGQAHLPHADAHAAPQPHAAVGQVHEPAHPVPDHAATGQEQGPGHDAGEPDPYSETVFETKVFPSTAAPPLNPIGPAEVAVIAGNPNPYPDAKGYSSLADRMTQGSRPLNLKARRSSRRDLLPELAEHLPTVFNDSHNHEGVNGGGYDTSQPHMDFERAATLSQDGTRKTFNFEVDPLLHAKSLIEARKVVPQDVPAYYAAKEGTAAESRNSIGKMVVGKRTVRVEEPGIMTVTGELLVKPGEYKRSEIEKIIGHPFEPTVREVYFMTSPKHASLDYGGTEVDNHHIDLVADYIGNPKSGANAEAMQKSLHIGLAGNDPVDPRTSKEAFKSLLHANRAERRNGLDIGTLKIAGFGELTIAKEMVGALSKLPALSAKVVRHIGQAVSSQKYTGGITTLHMDASITDMIPELTKGVPNVTALKTQGKAENLPWLKQLLKENEDQEFIWAHAGAAVTQTVPDGYIDMIDNMLKDHPNLKIDTSWRATADMMAGREFGDVQTDLNKNYDSDKVDAWAQLIAKHPDKFLWGSDNIAASHATGKDTVHETLKYFDKIGLPGRIKEYGGDEALHKFLNSNFDETIGKAADRVSTFRKDPANRLWLEKGGPSKENGVVPPNQWNKDKDGKWTFGPSALLPDGGNKEIYVMDDDVEPVKGANQIWLPDNTAVEGPGRMTGHQKTSETDYPLNPARFKAE